ncbi:MAG: hypothetical protein ACRCW0_04290 [Clostridium sp.]
MYYKEIYDFANKLNSNNIEENKEQLMRYISELILSFNYKNADITLEDLEDMLDIVFTREEIKKEIEDDIEEDKIINLIDEFFEVYEKFIDQILKRGYGNDAINLTKDIFNGLGIKHMSIGGIKELFKGAFEDDYDEKTNQEKCLNKLKEELYKYLKNVCNYSIYRQLSVIWALVKQVECQIEWEIRDFQIEMLDEINNEEIKDLVGGEYKNKFTKEYMNELYKRQYDWKVLASKFNDVNYIDSLCENN